MGNLHGLTPPPARTGGPTKPLYAVSIPEMKALAEMLGDESGEQDFEVPQLMWLANQPPEKLPNAEAVYWALDVAGLRGFVPIDNWRSVMERD